MHVLYLLSVVFVGSIYSWPDPQCRTPPLATNYTIEKYAGRWFEIGKIQTPGGAFFERDCICTHLDVAPNATDPTIVTVTNTCNKNTPDGKLIIAPERLTSNTKPATGRYNATYRTGTLSVAYNVIVLQTDDYSVEYDCGREFGITNYCVHIMSRKPTLDKAIVDNLLKLAEDLDLNTAKLEYKQTDHDGCSYPPPPAIRM